MSATTPRSCVTMMIAAPVESPQLPQLAQDLRLDRHVEGGRRLVRDQQRRRARERHRDHHALAHAARELVRVRARRARPAGDPDPAEQLAPRAPRPHVARRPRRARGSARRSGCRRAGPGPARTSGPGRPSRSTRRGCPRARPRSRPAGPRRRTPRSRSKQAFGERVRPSRVIAVTDLPDPDSPTIATTSPGATSKQTPSTACTTPSSVAKETCRSIHAQEAHRRIRGSRRA